MRLNQYDDQMSDKTFQVVFRGKTVSELSEEQVAVRLAALFKREPAAMRSLFDGERKILKRGLSRDKANHYREVLKKAGALVAVVAERDQAEGSDQPSRRASFAVDESTEAAPATQSVATAEPAASRATASVNSDDSKADSESSQDQSSAATIQDGDDFSLAPVGAILDHLKTPEIPQLDISELSLDDSGARFSEPLVTDPPQIDISHLEALADFNHLDEYEKPPPVNLEVDLDLDDSDDVLDATPPAPAVEIAIDHLESNHDYDHLDSSPRPTSPEINTDKLGLIE